jgi:NTE family protein
MRMFGIGGRTPLALALQGGGAHGAFTWGVLDALLEDGRHAMVAASGTSAGAINAIALAQGLLHGTPAAARQALAAFWSAMGTRVRFDAVTSGPAERPALTPLARAWMNWARFVAPDHLNPLGLNPLRDVLSEQIDFPALRRERPLRLFVAATNARTGQLRLFDESQLTLEAALASACLPGLQRAVEIDGEPYWDGGYSANPAVFPLVTTGVRDLLIVTLGPRRFEGVPRRVDDIRDRIHEFGFHAGYLRERALLDAARAQARTAPWPFGGRLDRLFRRLRVHVIDGAGALAHLDSETRLIAHLPFLEVLRDLGRKAAQAWLQERAR